MTNPFKDLSLAKEFSSFYLSQKYLPGFKTSTSDSHHHPSICLQLIQIWKSFFGEKNVKRAVEVPQIGKKSVKKYLTGSICAIWITFTIKLIVGAPLGISWTRLPWAEYIYVFKSCIWETSIIIYSKDNKFLVLGDTSWIRGNMINFFLLFGNMVRDVPLNRLCSFFNIVQNAFDPPPPSFWTFGSLFWWTVTHFVLL